MSADFFEAIRVADWALALSILGAQDELALFSPSSSPVAWFIELNAPPGAVAECLKLCTRSKQIKPEDLELLELCSRLASTHSNAFPTFRALLAAGLSPNTIVCGGDTLLQHLIGLNRVREVEELLRYGVDPHQMNLFGDESTSNLEGAREAGNAAGALVLAAFGEAIATAPGT